MEFGFKDNKNRYRRIDESSQPTPAAKKKRRFSLPKRTAALVSVLVALVLVGGTLALISVITNKRINAFTFGDTDIKIEENFLSWDLKEVNLLNVAHENSVPGVVRVMIVPVLKNKTTGEGIAGNLGALSDPGNGSVVILGDLTLELADDWASKWFYKDDYFYYREVLNPGVETSILLNKVTLTNENAYEKYVNVEVQVEVLADIIQAESTAAFDEWGVYVKGKVVSPTP